MPRLLQIRNAFTLLLIACGLQCAAQGREGTAFLDSLLTDLSYSKADTTRVALLVNIAYRYSTSDPEKGLRYADSALRLSHALRWQKGEGLAYNEFGNNYRQQAALPAALENYYHALRVAEAIREEDLQCRVYLNVGSVFYDQQAYDKALGNFTRSLTIARRKGNRKVEQLATGNIGNVYYAQEKFPLALQFMQQALAIAIATGDLRGNINQAGNIANVYSSMGNIEESLRWSFRALEIARSIGDEQVVAVNEGNIGDSYLVMAQDSSRSVDARRKSLDSAILYLRKGIAGTEKIAYTGALIDFTRLLAEAYALKGDFREALGAQLTYTHLKDSVFNLENNALLADLETKREVAIRDKDIQIAKLAVEKKRIERWFYIGGILLLLAVSAMLWRSYRRQRHSNVLLAREKQRSDDLLLNILPAGVADELKESGVAKARQFESVSVLFTDFVDFTGSAEKLSPTMLVGELHECFTAFDTICERHGLEKIKTIGDAYMAVCGIPEADPDHAVKSVRAALEMLEFIADRRQKQRAFEVRIGINSGPVVAGIVGLKKFAYDIWGDTVNTAARMEQHGAPGAINISHSTYELVQSTFECTYRGKVAAKHKGEVEMYFVGTPSIAESTPAAAQEILPSTSSR